VQSRLNLPLIAAILASAGTGACVYWACYSLYAWVTDACFRHACGSTGNIRMVCSVYWASV